MLNHIVSVDLSINKNSCCCNKKRGYSSSSF